HLSRLLERYQPDVVVSTCPAYPYWLQQISGKTRIYRSVVIVTDSITVNAIWYRAAADYFLVADEQSAAVVRDGGVAPEKIKVLGFPVSPRFAELAQNLRPDLPDRPRVLYMINAGTGAAPALVDRLLDLPIDLTVTVGRNQTLHRAVESVSRQRKIEIIGWTEEMPSLLC